MYALRDKNTGNVMQFNLTGCEGNMVKLDVFEGCGIWCVHDYEVALEAALGVDITGNFEMPFRDDDLDLEIINLMEII